MSKFQIILTSVFVVFIIIGVAVFASYKGSQNQDALPPIEVWGTLPANVVSELVQHVNIDLPVAMVVNYTEKKPAQFDKDFVETLARGGGPDAILIPQEMLLRHQDKIVPIPASIVTERSFKDTFVRQAETYIVPNGGGTLALPLTVDPIVMYWNRDMFTNAGLSTYPRFWDEFGNLGKKINVKDENSNIRRSVVALGEMNNLEHAREVLGTLFIQAGNPVTMSSAPGEPIVSALADGSINGVKSSSAALTFFTHFSNPSNPDYSWNRSLQSSKNAFLSGSLATYFGFASELAGIRTKNPNLDFDVAGFPQAPQSAVRATYGTMYGFSIVRSVKDPTSTYTILSNLVTPSALQFLTNETYLPPVRRDLIAVGNKDPYLAIFYDSALISKSWLDPDTQSTTAILQEMVDNVTSGKKTQYDAIQTADDKLNLLIRGI